MNARRSPGGRVVLALDQGTSSSRTLVVDETGAILATAQKTVARSYPRPGLVEMDPHEIWRCQLDSAVEALALAGVRAYEVAAVGITNQRETTVLWDRATGRARRNAIVWQDRRTAARCDELRAKPGTSRSSASRTGLLLDAYFSATKLAWLLDNVPRRPRARPSAANSPSARSTPGSPGDSPAAAATSPMRPTPRGRCSSTSIAADWDDELLALFGSPARHPAGGLRHQRGRSARRQAELPRRAHPDRRGSSATSRPRCSARPARAPGMAKSHLRHGLLPPDEHRATTVCLDARPADDGRLAARRDAATTRSRAASSWPARPSSGCATGSASSTTAAESGALAGARAGERRRLLRPGLRRPRGAALGRRTRAARSSASPAGTTPAHLARAALEAIAFRSPTCYAAMTRILACTPASCASTAAPRPTTSSCRSRQTSSASRSRALPRRRRRRWGRRRSPVWPLDSGRTRRRCSRRGARIGVSSLIPGATRTPCARDGPPPWPASGPSARPAPEATRPKADGQAVGPASHSRRLSSTAARPAPTRPRKRTARRRTA